MASIIALRDGIAVAEKRSQANRGRDDMAAFQIKRFDVDFGQAREIDDDRVWLAVQRHMQFIVRAFHIRFMARMLHHDAVHIDVEIIECPRRAFDDMVGHGKASRVRRKRKPHTGSRVGLPTEVRISVEGVHFGRREAMRDDAVIFADNGFRALNELCEMIQI